MQNLHALLVVFGIILMGLAYLFVRGPGNLTEMERNDNAHFYLWIAVTASVVLGAIAAFILAGALLIKIFIG